VRVCYLDLDGTLMGPGGCLLRGADGRFSDAGVRALGLLERRGVPVVLVSGRAQAHLREMARVVGAQGYLAELGALDADFPTAPGQSVYEAIAATGLPEALLDREPGLWVHSPPVGLREGSHSFRGRASAEGAAWVAAASAGSLRLVDNGVIGPGGERVYHLLPSAAGKAPAVARDLAVRGAEADACLAVGDSLEDLELAAVVGYVALVGNARAANGGPLEDAAGVWVTEGCYGAGVLEAVEAWLAGAAPPGVTERRPGAP